MLVHPRLTGGDGFRLGLISTPDGSPESLHCRLSRSRPVKTRERWLRGAKRFARRTPPVGRSIALCFGAVRSRSGSECRGCRCRRPRPLRRADPRQRRPAAPDPNPIFTAEEQSNAVGAILDKVGISGLAGNFIRLVASKRRLFVLPDMIRAFRNLVSDAKGIVQAQVTLAEAPSDTVSERDQGGAARRRQG